jgi:serine/threonine-protein kinase
VRAGEPVPVPQSISGATTTVVPRRRSGPRTPVPKTPTKPPAAPRSGSFPTPLPGPVSAPVSGPLSGPLSGPGAQQAPRRGVDAPRSPARGDRPPPRRPTRHAAPPPAPPTEPLRLQPKPDRGRTVLLVLFVLLTLAAVAVGVYVLRTVVFA